MTATGEILRIVTGLKALFGQKKRDRQVVGGEPVLCPSVFPATADEGPGSSRAGGMWPTEPQTQRFHLPCLPPGPCPA